MAANKKESEHRNIVPHKLDDILLDRQNPRIAVSENASQSTLLRVLFDESLEDLALSFKSHSYFSEEPIVVVPAEESGKYVVVEGNRRVATLKILLDSKLRKSLGATGWPTLTDAEQEKLQQIPTVEYSKRDDVVPYLGFRHITGILTWGPFAKARYVTQLIEEEKLAIERVEMSIGDSVQTVKKLYREYVLYRQIIQDLEMKPETIRSSFSLLHEILNNQPIKEYLGVERGLPSKPIKEVVAAKNMEKLREIVVWIFGDPTQGKQRIISDSRLIRQRLGPIVANSKALAHFRKTLDLEESYEYSDGEKVYLMKQLAGIERYLRNALGIVSLYADDEEVKSEIDRIRKLLQTLVESQK